MENSHYSPVSPSSPGDRGHISPGQPVPHGTPASEHPTSDPPPYDSLLDVELARSLVEEHKKSIAENSLSGKKDRNGRAKGRAIPVAVPSPQQKRVSFGAAAAARRAPLRQGVQRPGPPQHFNYIKELSH